MFSRLQRIGSYFGIFPNEQPDPPPAYQTNDPHRELSLGPNALPPTEPFDVFTNGRNDTHTIELDDIPINWFKFHISIRQEQQAAEWQRLEISSELFGDTDSQRQAAQCWVVDCWQKCGLWEPAWPSTGPSLDDRWSCGDVTSNGVPLCLLSLELNCEIEHLLYLQRPPPVSHLLGGDSHWQPQEPLQWDFDRLVSAAMSAMYRRRSRSVGVLPFVLGQSSLHFRRDLPALRAALPVPARERLDSLGVHCWDDLSRRDIGQRSSPDTTDIFGFPILPPNNGEVDTVPKDLVAAVDVSVGNGESAQVVGRRRSARRKKTTRAGGSRATAGISRPPRRSGVNRPAARR